jgi:NitT/TauT family transport system permease protein
VAFEAPVQAQARPALDVMRAKQASASRAVLFWRVVVGIAILLFWQWASGPRTACSPWCGGLIRPTYLAEPTAIAVRLVEVFRTGVIWPHIWMTFQEIVIGFALGGSTGMAAGFLLGGSPALSGVFEPYIMAFYGIPRIALAPILIILFGIGIWSKVAIVIIQVFFMMFVNAYAGVKNINQEYISLARIMGANRALILRKIMVPSTMPFIMLELRSAVPYAVIGAIVGEFIGASRGLGYFINYAGSTFDSAGAFAGIFILLAFILFANALMQWLERSTVKWKRTEGQVVQG